jgi:hypothetical protein
MLLVDHNKEIKTDTSVKTKAFYKRIRDSNCRGLRLTCSKLDLVLRLTRDNTERER